MPSSVISTISYFPATAILRIVFLSGSIYDYLDVPASIYEAMKRSGSKGTYLNNHIKTRFKFKKVS